LGGGQKKVVEESLSTKRKKKKGPDGVERTKPVKIMKGNNRLPWYSSVCLKIDAFDNNQRGGLLKNQEKGDAGGSKKNRISL